MCVREREYRYHWLFICSIYSTGSIGCLCVLHLVQVSFVVHVFYISYVIGCCFLYNYSTVVTGCCFLYIVHLCFGDALCVQYIECYISDWLLLSVCSSLVCAVHGMLHF